MDAFPGYTYFNPTRKVLCVIQVVEDASAASKSMQTVFPHKDDESFETSKEDSYIEPQPEQRWEKMEATKLQIPTQTETEGFSGKPVSEMITSDTYVDSRGRVIGTMKHIDNFTEFNPTDVTEQSGYYFPVKLGTGVSGTNMTLIKNGIPIKEGEFKSRFLLHVDENKPNTAWTIQVDGTDTLTLYFRNVNFE